MNHHIFILKQFLLPLFAFIGVHSYGQQIDGVINHYTNVMQLSEVNCKAELEVVDASNYTVGEKVLLFQSKDGTFDQSNTANYGDPISMDNAGNYEFAIIDQIVNNTIILGSVLTRTYTVGNGLQLITVPNYTNATITNTLTAANWNGLTGGVLVLEVSNTLTFNANIDVTGKGFAAGQSMSSLGNSCGEQDFFYSSTNNNGADKGEGIYEFPASQKRGRGAPANGGGGGNNFNAGGGGGSNYGRGGTGGKESSSCPNASNNGGIGGHKLLYTNIANKIFLGGGGGAGHHNLNATNTPGGNGGGIVIILASNIEGNNFRIYANGEDAPNPTLGNEAGRGGGGGAGAILLRATNYLSLLNTETIGGNGGNLNNTGAGPGGGGGGGAIWMSQLTTPANLMVSVLGGNAGTDNNGQNYGSGNGGNGVVINNLNIPDPISVFSFGPDTTLCPGDTLTLDATTPGATYLWQDSSTAPTFLVEKEGIYSVQITVNGCSVTDSIEVFNLDNIYLGPDTAFCNGDSHTLTVNIPNAFYQWSTGETTPSITVTTGGVYAITASLNNCVATDSLNLEVVNYPYVDLGLDTVICQEEQNRYTLNAYHPNAQYLWSTGETTAQIQVDSNGIYYVNSWVEMCHSYDTVAIAFIDNPKPNLGADTTICMGDNLAFNMSQPYSTYLWSNGSTQPVFDLSLAGKYWVQVSNYCGISADTLSVSLMDCECDVFLPNSFTPNANGDNDTFYPQYNCDFYSYLLRIYDPWGNLVFHSANPEEQWDGTYVTGKKAGPGMYGYVLVYQTNPIFEEIKTGSIYLLK